VSFPLDEENLSAVKRVEDEALDQIKSVIKTNGSDIASLIIEPIQGEGGDNFFRKEFLQALRVICDENEIMLIFDEVQTGMGLTGKMWAWEHFDVAPDLMTFGKKTQVCGCVSSRRIDEVPDNVFKESSRINSTWGGNLTDMVRSTIYLEIIKEENLLDAAAYQGKYLKTHMQSLQEEFPELVINPRGLGLMCAFDLPTGAQRDDLAGKIIENGVFILGSGEKAIRFRPPLNISRDELDTGMEIVRTSMKQLY
jgi:L-lysine 6-transaminase